MKLFEVYDGLNQTILDGNTTIAANTGRQAVIRFLEKKHTKYTSVKASGDNDVQIKIIPFKIGDDGHTRYAAGRSTWWKVIV